MNLSTSGFRLAEIRIPWRHCSGGGQAAGRVGSVGRGGRVCVRRGFPLWAMVSILGAGVLGYFICICSVVDFRSWIPYLGDDFTFHGCIPWVFYVYNFCSVFS